MTAAFFLFLLFGGIAVVSALTVVLHPHPVYCALALVVTLFQVAILFLLLEAHLLAFLQVVIYAGAIMVLFLFVIMLLNLPREAEVTRPAWRATVLGVGGLLGVELVMLFARSHPAPAAGALVGGFGSVNALSRELFSRYAFSFEVTSVLLLVAVIGAVVLAKRRID
ncbi:MAG: NADH-quinone oxidoreductase subunit [Candidatus Binatota bacterium]|jgi:NADH-quinone oxidoreductase subunit J|nr:NADH-quinone oxidoreductase subunit [Candidatus Binatota bacterium]